MPQIVSTSGEEVSPEESKRLATYNDKVCAAWKEVKVTQDVLVFEKKLFDRIALVISNDAAHLQPHELLNAGEQDYQTVFEKHINIKKVKDNLALSRHISYSAKYQVKGVEQIEHIHSVVGFYIPIFSFDPQYHQFV